MFNVSAPCVLNFYLLLMYIDIYFHFLSSCLMREGWRVFCVCILCIVSSVVVVLMFCFVLFVFFKKVLFTP